MPALALSLALLAPVASRHDQDQHTLESVRDLAGKLTPEQKELFDSASKQFDSQHYAEALATFKKLQTSLPDDPALAKFASEAAVNTGDDQFAIKALKPVTTASPDDWQATALLTRACAEAGDNACRDAEMAHEYADLHTGTHSRGG